VAEPFPLADDGFALLLIFLVEFVDVFHRPPVRDMPHVAFSEEAVEHAAARQQSDMSFVQRRHRSSTHLLVLRDQNAAGLFDRQRVLQRIFDGIERQACVVDRHRRGWRNWIALFGLLFENRNVFRTRSGTDQQFRLQSHAAPCAVSSRTMEYLRFWHSGPTTRQSKQIAASS